MGEPTQIDRAYATSQSLSVVTMAVSRTVFKIFDFNEYDNLEIRVRGQSRSLKRVPFDRSATICYQCSLVTLSLKRTVLKMFAFEDQRNLEPGFEITQGHRKRHQSTERVRLTIHVLQQLWLYLVPLRYSAINLPKRIFLPTLPYSTPRVGTPQIFHCDLRRGKYPMVGLPGGAKTSRIDSGVLTQYQARQTDRQTRQTLDDRKSPRAQIIHENSKSGRHHFPGAQECHHHSQLSVMCPSIPSFSTKYVQSFIMLLM